MTNWLVPTIGFVLILGAQGVCAKVALEHVSWLQLLIWTSLVSAGVAVALFALGTSLRPPRGSSGALLALAAVMPVASLALFYVALELAPASRVVPVSSVYPLVTVVLAYAFLSEEITLATLIGTVLIAVGVALVVS